MLFISNCVCRYSDLIVGAPFYGLFDSPNTGRIVAYLSDKEVIIFVYCLFLM